MHLSLPLPTCVHGSRSSQIHFVSHCIAWFLIPFVFLGEREGLGFLRNDMVGLKFVLSEGVVCVREICQKEQF